MTKSSKLLYFLISFFFAACANIVAPTGGPSDTQPPVLTNVTPANKSTNLQPNTLIFTFNENVKVNIDDHIIITPNINPMPKIVANGKKVTFTFQQKLRENQTYQIQLNEAIQDITENNTLPLATYVFSTGNALDSGIIRLQALQQLPFSTTGKMSFSLFDATPSYTDSLKPIYTAKGKSLKAQFEYLPQQQFNAIVFEDLDNNRVPDVYTEPMAYWNNAFATNDTVLPEVISRQERYLLKDFKPKHFNQVALLFNIPPPYAAITAIDTVGKMLKSVFFTDKDTIFIETQTQLPKYHILIPKGIKTDTITIIADDILNQTPKVEQKNYATTPIFWETNGPVFTFNTAIQALKKDSILITDTTNKPINFDTQIKENKVELVFKQLQGNRYNIIFKPGAVEGLQGLLKDSVMFKYDVPLDESRSSWHVLVNDTLSKRIKSMNAQVQMCTESGTVIKQWSWSEWLLNTKLNRINPGNYYIRIFDDANNDGKLTGGDIYKNQKPEKVMAITNIVPLKPNWVIETKAKAID